MLASEVRVIAGPNAGAVYEPYTQEELTTIIKRGELEPRRLTLEESRRASRNRAKTRDDARSMERWGYAQGTTHRKQYIFWGSKIEEEAPE